MDQPDFEIAYEGKNITPYIKPNLIELSYTDNLADQSDELAVSFEDIDRKWIGAWFPTQGDKLTLSLGYTAAPLAPLGVFEIDEVEWQHDKRGGSVVSLRALSTGISKSNRTLKPKAYENTTLADIVRRVAKRLDLSVTGTVANVPIKRVTQYHERDVEFLTRLAHEYNHSFKIVGKTMVFTTMASLEMRAPVVMIDLADVLSLTLRDRIKDAVEVVEVRGYDATAKKTVAATKKAKNKRNNKKRSKAANADTLKVVTRGESQEQMEARADAALSQATDDRQAGSITLVGNPKLVAGNTVWLSGFGLFSGKYLITGAEHTLNKRQGYLTRVEVRMLTYSEGEPNADSDA